MTGRLPFDPSKIAGPKQGQDRNAGVLTVSQLGSLIEGALRDRVPASVRVVGEVSNLRHRTHWYFDLKDADAVVSCVMWASDAARSRQHPEDGDQVVAAGRVQFFARQGKTQLYVTKVEPLGEGALERDLRRRIEQARELGWLDTQRKRPLPTLPRRVAVVTSATGAALQDVLDTLARRCPMVGVALADVPVQGERAAEAVAHTIRRLNARHKELGVDVVLVTRGGGSREDLWAFNDTNLAEAIVHSALPVVCAIGHETDVTLAELVADVRAATPTQAAVLLSPDADSLGEQIAGGGALLRRAMVRRLADTRGEMHRLSARLAGSIRTRVGASSLRHERASARLARLAPTRIQRLRREQLWETSARLERAVAARIDKHRVQDLALRLERAGNQALERLRERIATARRELDLVDPGHVLGRGYSITFAPGGGVVRSSSQVGPGDRLVTRVGDGELTSRVEGVRGSTSVGRSEPAHSRRRKRRNAPGTDRSQMDLFGGQG